MMMMMMESSYTIFWRDWEKQLGSSEGIKCGVSSAVAIHGVRLMFLSLSYRYSSTAAD